MTQAYPMAALALATGAMLALAQPAMAESDSHDHAHSHDHSAEEIYKGHFDDDQVQPRALTDWAGDWQSVYPLLLDGTLDPVFADKAVHGDKTAAEYTAYYQTGYATDVDRIEIGASHVTFFRDGVPVQGEYASDGQEILTYSAGNRGVRFIFAKTSGDAAAPAFIQFSDHRIAPEKSDHYHLYWGDDRAALLAEVTNWPTYFPAGLSGSQVAEAMMAH
ncbi:metal-binding protein ZinT [Pseudooceanicola aestuarii]|uniref:metal-binding protein ZinT n=1 Tax=Pseudooceanicola aestuarii TaxID=2697319 RepID=UPI0013CFE240|nr:metal-binding protein ZinT [Pseudooceanicola aestuarii]